MRPSVVDEVRLTTDRQPFAASRREALARAIAEAELRLVRLSAGPRATGAARSRRPARGGDDERMAAFLRAKIRDLRASLEALDRDAGVVSGGAPNRTSSGDRRAARERAGLAGLVSALRRYA